MSQQKTKQSPATQRANEALERAAPESKSPARKTLAFLLEGSHDAPQEDIPKILGESPPVTTSHHQSPPVTTSHRESIAPARDFNRRANSLERDAMPSGLFPGSSKKIYDALYLRTIGAIVPRSLVRASRRDLLEWTGIKNLKTIDNHVRHLMTVGLIVRHWELGSTEGSEYEVRLPEDSPRLTTTHHQSPLVTTSQKTSSGYTQFSGSGGEGQTLESITTSEPAKTSFKTNTERSDDDEAFAAMCSALKQATKDVTGREPSASDTARWAEVAEVLVTELKIAAGRTSVSSAPSFLAEHLRRRLFKKEKAQLDREEKEAPAVQPTVNAAECVDCFGSGMWYPGGYEKGVAKCRHEKLTNPVGNQEEKK